MSFFPQILGLLGFRSAAALPAHLHGAVLQLLLPGLEESLAPSATTDAGATACARTWKRTSSLRSEGCAIQCLFSAWLTKTSKWLKAPRFRYVLLLAVRPENAPTQLQGLSASSRDAYGAISAAGQGETNIPGKPSLPGAVRQQQDGQPSLQLLLVFFKVPALSFSEQGVPPSHFHELQGAELSEAFTIDSSHVRPSEAPGVMQLAPRQCCFLLAVAVSLACMPLLLYRGFKNWL